MLDSEEKIEQTMERIEKKDPDLLEFRFDRLHDFSILQSIGRSKQFPAIATDKALREPDELKKLLVAAADSGFEYVDVDRSLPNAEELIEKLRSNGTHVIVSSHDYHGTPSINDLSKSLEEQRGIGADVCKIITTATHPRDNLRILSFLEEKSTQARLISFAMGSLGTPSRILSPLFGAEFTFAALSANTTTAEGQLSIDNLRSVWQLLGIQ